MDSLSRFFNSRQITDQCLVHLAVDSWNLTNAACDIMVRQRRRSSGRMLFIR
jgi:hypothetical protein